MFEALTPDTIPHFGWREGLAVRLRTRPPSSPSRRLSAIPPFLARADAREGSVELLSRVVLSHRLVPLAVFEYCYSYEAEAKTQFAM